MNLFEIVVPIVVSVTVIALVYFLNRRKHSPKVCVVVPPKLIPEADLAKFDGKEGRPIYLAIKGIVYDVSAKAGSYGAGGSYEVLASKDASKVNFFFIFLLSFLLSSFCQEKYETYDEKNYKWNYRLK